MKPPSKISCILFDLDNTLVEIPDTWQYFDGIIVKTLAEDFHLPVPNQSMRDTLWRSGKDYVTILKEWGIDDPKEFWRFFDIRDSQNRILMIQEHKMILYSDVIPVLDTLRKRKMKLGIITNTPTFIAETELKAFGLMPYFDVVLGLGDNQTICKPEPDGVILGMKSCKSIPRETLLVGDGPIDLVAAKRAGVAPILIDRTRKKNITDPELLESDFIRIKSLTQILQWIN